MTNHRLSMSTRAVLLAAGASLALPAMAEAPIGSAAVAAVAEQPADPAIAPSQDDEDDYDDYVGDEIIVTAPRPAGQLDTDIKAEAELDEAAIASYGVSNVSELVDALAPQTRSGRGRGSGRPIILVNGRRIGGFGEVRNLPPEAIAKVEIFPEEVALQYGYAETDRVVNLVLKPNFRQLSVEAEGGIPTQGGRFQSEIEPSFVAIGKNGRVNLIGGWEHNTMLLERERGFGDTGRSLLPEADTYSIDGTIQRSLNKVTDASLNLRLDQTDSLSLLGPGAGGASDPLERDSRSRNLTSTASVPGARLAFTVSARPGRNTGRSRSSPPHSAGQDGASVSPPRRRSMRTPPSAGSRNQDAGWLIYQRPHCGARLSGPDHCSVASHGQPSCSYRAV